MKNYLVLFLSLLVSEKILGQSLPMQKEINLLAYSDSIGYSEGTIKIRDTLFTEVFHRYLDEKDISVLEVHCLDILITGPVAAKKKRVLDLYKDSALVRAKYRFQTFLNTPQQEIAHGKVSGRIEIIASSRRTVTIKIDVYAFDITGTEKRKWTGIRTFRKRSAFKKMIERPSMI